VVVELNGSRPRLIDPNTGQPFEGYNDRSRFAVAPILSYASIVNQSLQVYSAVRRDDAMRFGRKEALAMERDCFIQSLMEERYESTFLLEYDIVPEDAKDPVQLADAEWHKKIIERTPFFQRYRRNLLQGIWFGRSGVQHLIGRKPNEMIMGRPCWRIHDHSPVRGDKIEFAFQLDDGIAEEGLREGDPLILINPAHTEKIERQGGKILRSDQYPSLWLTPGYWRERFAILKHLTKDYDPFEDPQKQGCIHGYGVRDQIFYMDWLRKEWMANVADFIAMVGKGAVMVPYDASNPANADAALQAYKEQSQNTVILWPVWPGQEKVMPMPLNIPMTGSETLLKLMDHMEGIIERYIVGQGASASSETSGMGTHNTGFQESTKYMRIKGDVNNLDEVLTDELLGVLHRWNSPQARYKLFFKSRLEKPNASEMLQAAGELYQMNVPIKADEVRGYAGYTKPEEGEEVVQQPQPMVPVMDVHGRPPV